MPEYLIRKTSMRSTHIRRAAMIGTAAFLLAAPCAILGQAEPAPPTPALPADLAAAMGPKA
ncbi:hypothetical protein ABZ412_22655 [Nocardia sp. NPDC005746]|uniref:hypothetical protein n=1 Tax=unclassified Nocardia TaxID=2637762 RepID=UPI0034031B89